MTRFRAACLVGVVLLGTSVVLIATHRGNSAKPEKMATGPADSHAVAALGRIRPLGDILEVGADASRRVARLVVEEGQKVKKDEILAYLDNYDESQASFKYAESQYQSGETQLKFRTALEQANIDKAQAELRLLEQAPPREIAVQEKTAEKNRLELELAEKEAKRLERLVEKGSAPREDLDKKLSEVAVRTCVLEAAREELARMQAALPINQAKAKANLASARANLKFLQAQLDVESLRANRDLAKTRMQNAMVRAPADGTILRIRTRAGEALRNQTVLTMGDLGTMCVVAEVYESDLLALHPGQPAKITARTLPQPLTGKVVRVGRLITRQTVMDLDPSSATDARVAEVRIELDTPDPASRLVNLQVTATIDTSAAAEKTAVRSARKD